MKKLIIGLSAFFAVGLVNAAELTLTPESVSLGSCPPYCICHKGHLPECTMSPEKDEESNNGWVDLANRQHLQQSDIVASMSE